MSVFPELNDGRHFLPYFSLTDYSLFSGLALSLFPGSGT